MPWRLAIGPLTRLWQGENVDVARNGLVKKRKKKKHFFPFNINRVLDVM